MLPLKRRRGVAHSCNCLPPRLSDVRLADALVECFCLLERQSPSLDDLEKSLQNASAMLQSTPPKPVSAAAIMRPTLQKSAACVARRLSVMCIILSQERQGLERPK